MALVSVLIADALTEIGVLASGRNTASGRSAIGAALFPATDRLLGG